MKRCKAQFGEVGPGGAPLGTDDDAAAGPVPVTPAKRSRKANNANGSSQKGKVIKDEANGTDEDVEANGTDEDVEVKDEDGKEESPTKKAKTDNLTDTNGKADTKVKVKAEKPEGEAPAANGDDREDEG
jgi:hypothetical protein